MKDANAVEVSDKPEVTQQLTQREETLLEKLEEIIKEGQTTFIKVGEALAEIRDTKLYRKEFDTFQEYCQTKWGFSRVRAHQLMEASELVKELPAKMLTQVNTEKKARVLSRVKPERRVKVLQKAKKIAGRGKPITTKILEKAAGVKPTQSKPAPVGGIAADAKKQDERKKQKELGACGKMLAAVDIWWEELKPTLAYADLTPVQMINRFKKLIEETL